jgi:hypothetical protein
MKDKGYEPALGRSLINPTSEPEERAVNDDSREKKHFIFEDF